MNQDAMSNLVALSQNPYPGRGLVVGLDQIRENLVQIYWIMGRSENSRNPLPAFFGEPFPLPLEGDIKAVVNMFWDVLNETNRVALAVKFINRQTGESTVEIINKYSKVE